MKPLVVFACLVTGTLLLVRLAPLPLPPPAPSTRIETVGDGFPLVLIDPTGRRTVLPSPPNRIASTTLGTDEILLELVDPSRLVTLSSIADDARYSSISERAPAVAGRVDRGVESILSHTPDLVLVATYTATETVDILLRAGLPTFRLGAFTSLSDIEQNIHTLARLVGRIERGQALVARMRHRLETVESALPPLSTRPKALFLTRGLSTAGSNTTVDEILRRAGA